MTAPAAPHTLGNCTRAVPPGSVRARSASLRHPRPVPLHRRLPCTGAEQRSDLELLRAHVAGERDAFAALVTRHRERLWRIAVSSSISPEDAADCLQEALLSAHRSAARFRDDAAVSSWLHAIVVNACRDRLRRNQARPRSVASFDDGFPAPAVADRSGEVDLRLVVADALATLPAEQREAVTAVYLRGLTVEQAALALDVAAGTVKSRCSRGRRRLAELLAAVGPGAAPGRAVDPQSFAHVGARPGNNGI